MDVIVFMYTPNKKINKQIEERALQIVASQFSFYDTLLTTYRDKWDRFFRASYLFENERKGQGKSTMFFPKCFEHVEKIAPRLTANDPKFVVQPIISGEGEGEDVTSLMKRADTTQKYIHYAWSITNGRQKLKDVAKGGLIYGTQFAKVNFETKKRTTKSQEIDEVGDAVDVTKEVVSLEYPTFEAVDIFDVYFDPRIKFVDDMHSVVLNKNRIRLSELLNNEEHYINVKKLKKIDASFEDTGDNRKDNKFTAEGIPDIENKEITYVNVKEYYGYFSETGEPKDEKLVQITVVNNEFVIEYNEIDFIPFEKFTPVGVPNQGAGIGAVEPIYDVHKAYNLTRNQRFENVTMIMNRMWLLKQSAGVDPRRLKSFPGNIIPVRDMEGIQPLDTPDITASSYNEADALNTEMQSILGTIDATQDSSSNGFTNLATGQKIRWNEFNARYKSMKENLEDFMSALGRKMLMMVAAKASINPKIYDKETRKFYELAKDAFDSFDDFYSIRVKADSTSFDSIENARDEALAKSQILLSYAERGVNIALDKALRDILNTFPGTISDEYILPPQATPEAQPETGAAGALPKGVIDQAKPQLPPDQQLNQSLSNV